MFGVVILCGLGAAFSRHAEVLLGHKDDPPNGQKVAEMCYSAAVVYAVFVLFCGCQVRTHHSSVSLPSCKPSIGSLAPIVGKLGIRGRYGCDIETRSGALQPSGRFILHQNTIRLPSLLTTPVFARGALARASPGFSFFALVGPPLAPFPACLSPRLWRGGSTASTAASAAGSTASSVGDEVLAT